MTADESAPDPPPRLTPRRLLGGIKLGWAIRKAYRGQLEPGSGAPAGGVFLNERASALAHRARDLAGSDLDDAAAAAELAALASGHEYDLQVAAASLEDFRALRVHDRAWRLAVGALNGGQVPAVAEEDDARFQALEEWESRPAEERYAVLLTAAPELAEIAATVQSEGYERLPIPARVQAVFDARGPTHAEEVSRQLRLDDPRTRVRFAVDEVLGPASDWRDDPVLGTSAAIFFAVGWVLGQA